MHLLLATRAMSTKRWASLRAPGDDRCSARGELQGPEPKRRSPADDAAWGHPSAWRDADG